MVLCALADTLVHDVKLAMFLQDRLFLPLAQQDQHRPVVQAVQSHRLAQRGLFLQLHPGNEEKARLGGQ